MTFNYYEISAATLAGIGVALVAGAVLALILHRGAGVPVAKAGWAAAAAVSAVAVLLITLAPSGRGGTFPCSLAVEGSVFDWLKGKQSTANAAMLVPVAIALPLATRGTRWHRWSFVALLALPVVVELGQARLPIGRACDVTDVVDNWWGVALGGLLGWLGTVIARRGRVRRLPVDASDSASSTS